MVTRIRLPLVVILTAFSVVATTATADAHKRSYRHSHARDASCHGSVEGRATGLGLFGTGTANARSAAVSNWAEKVNARWGIYYANFDNARRVRWDCKKGAILQAKCVVVAMPCR